MKVIYAQENKSGPNIEHCGAPYFMGSKSDLESFTQTSCCRFDRNEETNLRVSFGVTSVGEDRDHLHRTPWQCLQKGRLKTRCS